MTPGSPTQPDRCLRAVGSDISAYKVLSNRVQEMKMKTIPVQESYFSVPKYGEDKKAF